ncbi:MAG: nuclear transport factor 2 family protein [Myxococcales bacterium]
MSLSNVEIVQSFYDHFLSGKVEEGAEKFLAEDFALSNPLPESIPFGGVYIGPAGFIEYSGKILETLTMEEFVIEDVISEGDKVVVVGREVSKVHSTGRKYKMPWVHIFRVSAGRILEMREFNDTAAMVPAFESNS